jgi:putative hydrolase of the HAD superfamily
MDIVFDISGVVFNQGMDVAVDRISKRFTLEPSHVREVLSGDFSNNYRNGLESPKHFWERARIELGQGKANCLRDMFFDSYFPMQEVLDYIDELRAKGVKVGFLSNSPKDRAEYLEKKFSFMKHFDFGLWPFEAGFCKPDLRIYQELLSKFKLQASQVVFIDDMEKYLAPAKKLGFRTIKFVSLAQIKKEIDRII